jgi:hypothetical protein
MPMQNTKNRVIYFRLSESEFRSLSALCTDVDGGRNVSELARLAVRRLIREARLEDVASPAVALRDVEAGILELKERMEVVLDRLTNPDAEVGWRQGISNRGKEPREFTSPEAEKCMPANEASLAND